MSKFKKKNRLTSNKPVKKLQDFSSFLLIGNDLCKRSFGF